MRHVAMLPSLLTLGNFTCGLLSVVVCASSLHFHGLARQNDRYAALLAEGMAAEPGVDADADADVRARRGFGGVGRFRPASFPDRLDPETLRRFGQAMRERSRELFVYAGLLVFIGMFFDMLDGRVARMTQSESRFGAELDSLADICTFGVAPAVMTATLWLMAHPPQASWYGQVLFFAAVYAACAALRLARYNVEIGGADKNWFRGLPSPAAAGCVASAALFCYADGYLDGFWRWCSAQAGGRMNPEEVLARAVALYALAVGFLMVTRLGFVHVMNRYYRGRKKFTTLVLIVFLLVLLMEFPWIMLFAAFNGYVAACLAANAWARRKAPPWRRAAPPRDPAAPGAEP